MEGRVDGQDVALNRSEPSREGAAIVLGDDADEAFDGTEDDTVKHDRFFLLAVLIDVIAAEAVRQVDVELNGATLPSATHRILEFEVKFRAIEGAVARVDFVAVAAVFAGLGQRGFGFIPELDRSDVVLFRTSA